MHELSIALNIIEIAEEQLIEHGGQRIVSIHLRVGRLAGVAKEALLFCFDRASENTRAEGSRLVVQDCPEQELEIVALEIE